MRVKDENASVDNTDLTIIIVKSLMDDDILFQERKSFLLLSTDQFFSDAVFSWGVKMCAYFNTKNSKCTG